MQSFITFLFIFLFAGVAKAFVYSCEEVKYKLINSAITIPSCLFDIWSTTSAESFVWTSDCVRRPHSDPWVIVADSPDTLDCSEDFSLIFTSYADDALLIEKDTGGLGYGSGTVPSAAIIVSPQSGVLINVADCSGNGDITIYTGIGSDESEERYMMKSYKCSNLPKWILSFDRSVYILEQPGNHMEFSYSSIDYLPNLDWTIAQEDQLVVMSSGRSDNIQNLHPEQNVVKFTMETIVMLTAESLASFDPRYNGKVLIYGSEPDGTPWWQTVGAGRLGGEYSETAEFTVSYKTSAVAPEDIWNSEDNFIIEFSFEPTLPSTTIGTTEELILSTSREPLVTRPPTADADPYCGCGLDKKFGMPEGWNSTEIWIDVVIILDSSEAMGDVALADASSLIESFIGTDDGDVLNTDTKANFYTRVGLIAMSDTADVIYNLNMTKADKVKSKVQIKKGVEQIDVLAAFNAALSMFSDGLISQPDRSNTRQVIYYMTDSNPVFDKRVLDDFLEPGDAPKSGLKDLASDGYYFTDIQYNYMSTIQLFCKANCFCRPDKSRIPYAGHSTDPAVNAAGGCFRVVPAGVPYSKMKANCEEGIIATIHDEDKANFVAKQFVAAKPPSDYFWIGYAKTDAGWTWEDNSTNPYTHWDTANGEPSSNSVAKCAYVDTTSFDLFWGAGNCNVGFPSVCEYAPCAVGNKIC